MAIQGIMLRACSVVGHGYKSSLCSRFFAPLYQQCISASKSSAESKVEIPEKPKKPIGAFFQYIKMLRPKLLAENPGITVPEIGKIVGEKWKTIDPALKQKLLDENHQKTKEYGEALQKYHLSLSQEQLNAIREAKAKVREEKFARSVRKKLKQLGKPKNPPTAYSLFIQEESKNITLKNLSPSEKFGKLGELWKSSPEKVHNEYREKAEAYRRQYKIDLNAWEEKMAASGFLDVYEDVVPKSKKKA